MHGWTARIGASVATAIVAGTLGGGAFAAAPAAPRPVEPTLTQRVDAAIDGVRAELLWDAELGRRWVHEAITTEAYPGVLKGARGAFLTGSANSTDQALLLATLLDDAALPLRFARCTLSPEAALDPEPTGTASRLLLEDVDTIAAGLTDEELRTSLLALPSLRREQVAAAEVAAEELATALDPFPIAGAANGGPGPVEHIWLQAAHGAAWVDLDTTTVTGEPPCAAAATMDRLPDSLFHQVRIALEVERRTAAGLKQTDALVVERPTADLSSARIAFGFAEPLGLLPREPVAVDAGQPYTPALLIDNELIAGDPLLLPRPSGAHSGAPGDEIVDIGEDLFGSPAPGARDAETDPVTGAWLRIELIAPADEATILRSEVFDRVGVVARANDAAATAPVGALEEIGDDHAATAALWQVGLLLGPAWGGVAVADTSLTVDSIDGVSSQLDALLRIFPAARLDLGGRPAGPSVVLAGLVPARTPEGRPGIRIVLDALHVPGAPAADALDAARDAQAVMGAETLLLSLLGPLVADAEDSATVLAAARATGTPFVRLAPGDGTAAIDASPAALARIGARLDAGATVLVPAVAPRFGDRAMTAWWVVDPVAGTVRDEHETGRHSTVEYEANTGRALSARERLRTFACRLVGTTIVAAGLVFAVTGVEEVGIALKQVAKAAKTAEENRQAGKAAREAACLGTGASGAPR